MVLLVGQVGRGVARARGVPGGGLSPRCSAPIAKWAAEIDDAARIPEIVAAPSDIAIAGRPGPVVLALPEDMLAGGASRRRRCPRTAPSQPHPGAAGLGALRELLAAAERPLDARRRRRLDAGRPSRTSCAFAEANGAAGRRRRSAARTTSTTARRSTRATSASASTRELAQRVTRRGSAARRSARASARSTTSGYTLVDVPRPRQRLVHVHPGSEELGRVYQADLRDRLGPAGVRGRCARARAGRRHALGRLGATRPARDYLEHLKPRRCPATVDLADGDGVPRERLPTDAILTNGAGNFTVWAHRFYQFRRYRTQLGPDERRDGLRRAGGGRGEDRASRADRRLLRRRRRLPDERAGARDGRRSTACRDRRRRRQQRHVRDDPHAPGAPVTRAAPYGTDLVNPDFAAYARAFGAHGETVVSARTNSPPAFERAVGQRPAGAARAPYRSRGDHTARDADGDSRRCPQRRCLTLDERGRSLRPGRQPDSGCICHLHLAQHGLPGAGRRPLRCGADAVRVRRRGDHRGRGGAGAPRSRGRRGRGGAQVVSQPGARRLGIVGCHGSARRRRGRDGVRIRPEPHRALPGAHP